MITVINAVTGEVRYLQIQSQDKLPYVTVSVLDQISKDINND
jgi:hypothetical protein